MATTLIDKRNSALVQVVLVGLASLFFCINISRPLIDYDEATYAKVVADTLHSGQVIDLYHFDRPWFEKPPLYLWTVMGSVSLFGEHEWTFRIPSVIFAVLCCWLVYFIALVVGMGAIALLIVSWMRGAMSRKTLAPLLTSLQV